MKIIQGIKAFLKRISSDHIGEYSAQCAYFTFLSFIPFVILLLSLIKYINIDRDTLVYILEAVLPTITKNSVLDIIQEVYSKSLETVSISAIFILWSAANSFYALSLGLSSIYKGEEKDTNYILLRVKGILGTIITLFSIIIVLILLVFGNRIHLVMQESFPGLDKVIQYIINIRSIVVIIALFIMFVLMYRFVPNKKGLKLKKQIPGALFAAVRVGFGFLFFFDIC